MGDIDKTNYNRVRVKHAKRLVAEFFAKLEALKKKGPLSGTELASFDISRSFDRIHPVTNMTVCFL